MNGCGVDDVTPVTTYFLVGKIPKEIGNLVNLEILYLHENKLSGKFLILIGCSTDDVTSPFYFHRNRKRTGEIAAKLSQHKNLKAVLSSSSLVDTYSHTANIPLYPVDSGRQCY